MKRLPLGLSLPKQPLRYGLAPGRGYGLAPGRGRAVGTTACRAWAVYGLAPGRTGPWALERLPGLGRHGIRGRVRRSWQLRELP